MTLSCCTTRRVVRVLSTRRQGGRIYKHWVHHRPIQFGPGSLDQVRLAHRDSTPPSFDSLVPFLKLPVSVQTPEQNVEDNTRSIIKLKQYHT